MKPPSKKQTDENRDDELFVQLFAANERRIRSYVRGLVMGEDAVNDVMQDVSLVLWRKFNQFDPDTVFLKWAYVVARYEVLMFRRKKARERLVFDESLLEVLATEAEEEAEALERERAALKTCLAKLRPEERDLLLTAYAQGMKLNQAADLAGRSATSVYKQLNRLRHSLFRCIESSIAST